MSEMSESDGMGMQYLYEASTSVRKNLECSREIVKELSAWGQGIGELVKQATDLVRKLEQAQEVSTSFHMPRPSG